MNLTKFLKQTDAIAAQYSAEQLTSFIHETARVLPEHQREDFLNRLKESGSACRRDQKEEQRLAFDEQYQQLRNQLKAIDSQEISIQGIYNEEYDDWYDDIGEEFYYTDEDGISDILEEACDFVHTCMDEERYEEGFQIGRQLFSMDILCENEYGGEEFSIKDMVIHELLEYDLKDVILDTAYCVYCAMPLRKRAEALYGLIVNAGEDAVTLEAIMQHGEELPDFQDFLTQWIVYLGGQTGHDADRLIPEAVELLNDFSQAKKYAKKYAAVHPRLYLSLLEHAQDAGISAMAALGLEAIKTIPKKYKMRSRVALKTAEYILEKDSDTDLLERCYFAAYESDSSPLNYLRVLLNGYGSEEKREELRNVFMEHAAGKSGGASGAFGTSSSERAENRPDGNTMFLLRFLDGQFAGVLKEGLNKREALGWSGTFMKQGIALYLLCVHDGTWTGRGMTEMERIAKNAMDFSAEEYRKGTDGPDSIKEAELFSDLFVRWKSMVPMEADVRDAAMRKIAVLLEKRIAGIMDANRRNYYGECAAFLAALGETRESLGEIGAKQVLMTAYKDKYSRRSAFRAEMRNYGWMDVKKKY